MKIYFDTNILNKLAYMNGYEYFFKRLSAKGYIVCISEVTILEILRDLFDLENIDKIITMLQNANRISKILVLPSINQVIIDFIKETKTYSTNNKVILDVINNRQKGFKIPLDSATYLKYGFKEEIKIVKNAIKALFEQASCIKCEDYYCENKITEMSQALIYLFLKGNYCIFDKDTLPSYFRKEKISTDNEIDREISRLSPLLLSNISPIRNMARMLISQKKNKTNGVFCDAMHMLYLHYVDLFASDDKHFKDNLSNVVTFDELIDMTIEYDKVR